MRTKKCFLIVFYAVGAEVVLKGTNVDGVYDRDPKKHPEAKLLRHLTHRHVALNDLKVMDITAITLCLENNIPGERPKCQGRVLDVGARRGAFGNVDRY